MAFQGTPRFVVKGKLGSGGMGQVYRVHDCDQGADVALKVLRRQSAREISGLKREFRFLKDMHHPNLVNLYELIAVGGWLDRKVLRLLSHVEIRG